MNFYSVLSTSKDLFVLKKIIIGSLLCLGVCSLGCSKEEKVDYPPEAIPQIPAGDKAGPAGATKSGAPTGGKPMKPPG